VLLYSEYLYIFCVEPFVFPSDNSTGLCLQRFVFIYTNVINSKINELLPLVGQFFVSSSSWRWNTLWCRPDTGPSVWVDLPLRSAGHRPGWSVVCQTLLSTSAYRPCPRCRRCQRVAGHPRPSAPLSTWALENCSSPPSLPIYIIYTASKHLMASFEVLANHSSLSSLVITRRRILNVPIILLYIWLHSVWIKYIYILRCHTCADLNYPKLKK